MRGKGRGRRMAMATGGLLVVMLAIAFLHWKEILTRYHLACLRRDISHLLSIADKPEGSLERTAVRAYLEDRGAQEQFLKFCVDTMCERMANTEPTLSGRSYNPEALEAFRRGRFTKATFYTTDDGTQAKHGWIRLDGFGAVPLKSAMLCQDAVLPALYSMLGHVHPQRAWQDADQRGYRLRIAFEEAQPEFQVQVDPTVREMKNTLIDSLVRAQGPAIRDMIAFLTTGNERAKWTPFLLEMLNHPDPAVRRTTSRVLLSVVTPNMTSTIGPLVKALADTEDKVRARAAATLGNIGEGTSAVVKGLVKVLSDPYYLARFRAAQSLGELRPLPTAAIAKLEEATRDEHGLVSHHAGIALTQIKNSHGLDTEKKEKLATD